MPKRRPRFRYGLLGGRDCLGLGRSSDKGTLTHRRSGDHNSRRKHHGSGDGENDRPE